MDIPTSVDVAIVGAGPVGLAAGSMLCKNGMNAVVFEATANPPKTSRATVIHSRTLELLEDLDLTEKLIAEGIRVPKFTMRHNGVALASFDFGGLLKIKYPMIISIPQSDTEAFLAKKMIEEGGSIFRSAPVTRIETLGDKVELEVCRGDTKTVVTASYVIGADGLHSFVRDAVKIPFEGSEYNTSFILADCKMESWPLPLNEAQLCLVRGGFIIFIPLPHQTMRIVATVDEAPRNPDLDLLQKLVKERGVAGAVVEEVSNASRFHIHHRLAKSYRSGRIFLAGDAAHVHSPAGGQGMNIGIQDGLELGTVLTDAIRNGRDTDQDLDRYEARRRPAAVKVLALTHGMTVMGTLKSPILCALRNLFLRIVTRIPGFQRFMASRMANMK